MTRLGTVLRVGDPATETALKASGLIDDVDIEIEWANITGGPKTLEAFRADALEHPTYELGIAPGLPWSPLAGGWLSGRYRRGEAHGSSSRAERQPARHDPSSPENKAKLEAVYALQELADQAGVSLIHLALGFVLKHPAISLAIIGPRSSSRSSARRRSTCRPTCSTASTRSCRPARPSTRPTGATHLRRSPRRRVDDADLPF